MCSNIGTFSFLESIVGEEREDEFTVASPMLPDIGRTSPYFPEVLVDPSLVADFGFIKIGSPGLTKLFVVKNDSPVDFYIQKITCTNMSNLGWHFAEEKNLYC